MGIMSTIRGQPIQTNSVRTSQSLSFKTEKKCKCHRDYEIQTNPFTQVPKLDLIILNKEQICHILNVTTLADRKVKPRDKS